MKRKSWRAWCPSCNRPYGRHQWGANRGKPIVCRHAALGSVMPRGLSPRERGAWLCANACPGSLQWGRRVTDAEEAELALASPSAALVRALRAVGEGEVTLDDFAQALYPDADRGRVSRVGARGVSYGAQVRRVADARLATLVRSGLASTRFVGESSETRRVWRLLPPGLDALKAAVGGDAR